MFIGAISALYPLPTGWVVSIGGRSDTPTLAGSPLMGLEHARAMTTHFAQFCRREQRVRRLQQTRQHGEGRVANFLVLSEHFLSNCL